MKLVDPDAEMAVIGSMLLGGTRHAPELAAALLPEHFAQSHTRVMFEAIVQVLNEGLSPDAVAVKSELLKRGQLEHVGGVNKLVYAMEMVPSPANGIAYASAVRELAAARQVKQRCEDTLALIKESDDVNEIISSATRIGDISYSSLNSTINLRDVNLSKEKDLSGIPSGFKQIDNAVLSKGWPQSELSLVMAPEGEGKSLLMLQSLVEYSKDSFARGTAAYVTLEMTPDALKRRMARMLCGVSKPKTLEQESLLDAAEAQIAEWDVRMFSPNRRFGSQVTIEEVAGWLMEEHRRSELSVAYIDYIQRLGTTRKTERSDQIARRVSGQLLDVAQSMNIAMVAASQVTLGDRGEYRVKEGNGPREDASLTIEMKMSTEPPIEVQARIGKNRHGPGHLRLKLAFNKEFVKFDEVEVR